MLSQVPGLLIACALKKEERGLRRHLGIENRILVTGLGVDRTLRSLEEEFDKNRPSCLLFSGMAGQLDPEVRLGEVLLPKEWRLESGTSFSVDERLARATNEAGFELSGTGVTVSRPVATRKKRLRLYQETGARICDMESAAAMMIAASYQIPCLAPKVVSDTADSGFMAFYREFDRNIELLSEYLSSLVQELATIIPRLDPV